MPTKPSVKPNAEIEPFVGESDANKTLLTKFLAVPAARYLTYRRDIAEKCLAWKKLGPVVMQWQKNDQPPLESPYQQAFFDGYLAPRSYRKQCRPRLWAHRPISA